MFKKLVSIAVAMAMFFCCVPASALASEKTDTSVPEATNIKMPEVDTFKIMLDAGHAGKYNKGAIDGYYESYAVWDITEYMAEAFSQYEGVTVGKTRSSQGTDLNIFDRGQKSKGYDLFVSNHTNSGGKTPDYPLVIAPEESKYYTSKVKTIAEKVGDNLKATLGTKQNPQIWRDSRYGVIRGAASVGTPGIIIEHSFHSNPTICKKLMDDAVLKKLAYDEADIIAQTFGVKKKIDDTATIEVESVSTTKNTISVVNSNANLSYEIYRGQEGGQYSKIATIKGNGGQANYTDTSLSKGKTYYYIARPVTSTTVGKYSSSVGVIMPGVETPTFDAYGYKYGMAKVTWQTSHNADKYIVKRANEKNGSYETIYESETAGEYIDKSFPNGGSKYYKVLGYNSKNGEYSLEPSANGAHIRGTMEKTVSFDAYGYGIGMAKVTWQANVKDAQGYEVLRATSKNGDYEVIARFTGDKLSTSSYVDKNVSKGKSYYYKVRAYTKVAELDDKIYYTDDVAPNGASVIGNVASTKVNAYGYGVGSAMVKWNKAANANGYKLYRRTGSKGSYKYIGATKSTSYKDKKVSKGKSYYYKVKPYRKTSAGTYYGKLSSANGATIISKVSRPSVKLAKSGKTSIKVSWSKAKGATGYKIYRATSAKGKYKYIKKVSASSSRYFYDKSKKKGKTYYYKVRAYSSANKTYYSSYSAVKKIRR